MPEYRIGVGSGKVHYGDSEEPGSVKCGNWMPYIVHLDWTDDKKKVTCKSCLKLLSRHDAAGERS